MPSFQCSCFCWSGETEYNGWTYYYGHIQAFLLRTPPLVQVNLSLPRPSLRSVHWRFDRYIYNDLKYVCQRDAEDYLKRFDTQSSWLISSLKLLNVVLCWTSLLNVACRKSGTYIVELHSCDELIMVEKGWPLGIQYRLCCYISVVQSRPISHRVPWASPNLYL